MNRKIYIPILVSLLIMVGIHDIQVEKYNLGTITLVLSAILGFAYVFGKKK